jgi:hypothetical protein
MNAQQTLHVRDPFGIEVHAEGRLIDAFDQFARRVHTDRASDDPRDPFFGFGR